MGEIIGLGGTGGFSTGKTSLVFDREQTKRKPYQTTPLANGISVGFFLRWLTSFTRWSADILTSHFTTSDIELFLEVESWMCYSTRIPTNGIAKNMLERTRLHFLLKSLRQLDVFRFVRRRIFVGARFITCSATIDLFRLVRGPALIIS